MQSQMMLAYFGLNEHNRSARVLSSHKEKLHAPKPLHMRQGTASKTEASGRVPGTGGCTEITQTLCSGQTTQQPLGHRRKLSPACAAAPHKDVLPPGHTFAFYRARPCIAILNAALQQRAARRILESLHWPQSQTPGAPRTAARLSITFTPIARLPTASQADLPGS